MTALDEVSKLVNRHILDAFDGLFDELKLNSMVFQRQTPFGHVFRLSLRYLGDRWKVRTTFIVQLAHHRVLSEAQ